MKLDNITNKLKKIAASVILVGALAIAGNSYYNLIRDIGTDTKEMTNLIKNSPRTEYVVKEGDRLDKLRNKFFPMYHNEFKALGNQHLSYGTYKEISADNNWTRIVRKENKLPWTDCFSGMYQTHAGDTLKVPARKHWE